MQGLAKHRLITISRVSASGDGSPPQPDEKPEGACSRKALTEKKAAPITYMHGAARIGSDLV